MKPLQCNPGCDCGNVEELRPAGPPVAGPSPVGRNLPTFLASRVQSWVWQNSVKARN